MKKNIRKIGLIFAISIIVLLGCSDKETGLTVGDTNNNNNTDVVLVMDKSESMQDADPDRLAIEGAKLFVDMEKVSGSRISLVEFASEIDNTDLIEMQEKDDKKGMRDRLDDMEYIDGSDTDTGAALKKAVSILEENNSNNNKAIILFTDGRTSISEATGRTTEDSKEDVKTAVQTAVKKGYTIYCIGLNSDNGVDKEELENIAYGTGGEIHIAENVEEIEDFFNLIFNKIGGIKKEKIDEFVGDSFFHDFKFTISDSNVSEANIIILSSDRPKVILTNNKEKVVDLEEDKDENIIFSPSKAYSLIKLINPDVGEWNLRVKGASEDQIRIEMIYNYDLSLIAEVDKSSLKKGEKIGIKAYLATEGEAFTDQDFYQGMSGSFKAKEASAEESIKGTLELNEEGDAFEGTFVPTDAGDYKVSVHLEGNRLFRDSKTFNIKVSGSFLSGNQLTIVLITICGLVLLGVILVKRTKGSKRIDGVFRVSVIYALKDENGVFQQEEYDIANDIPASSVGKKEFTMERLLKLVQNSYYNNRKKTAFNEHMGAIMEEAKKIKVVGCKEAFTIKVKNKSMKAQFIDRGSKTDKKILNISIANNQRGLNLGVERQFGVYFPDSEDRYTEVKINYKKM